MRVYVLCVSYSLAPSTEGVILVICTPLYLPTLSNAFIVEVGGGGGLVGPGTYDFCGPAFGRLRVGHYRTNSVLKRS